MKEDVLKRIYEKRLLPESSRELATAIVCGNKCGDLQPEQMETQADGIMKEMFVYYGQNINDETARLMKEIIPIELKKFHYGLTIEEIGIGVRLSLRGQYGETDYKKVSIKLFNELIARYLASQHRKSIINAQSEVLDEMRLNTKCITQEQKDRSLINCLCKDFDKYCSEGPKALMWTALYYDFFLRMNVPMPDYSSFLKEAAQIFQKKSKNEVTISEAMTKMFQTNIRGEAKLLALLDLLKTLKEQGQTLRQYITQTSPLANQLLT